MNSDGACNIVNRTMSAQPGPTREPTREQFDKFLRWLSQDLDTAAREFEKLRRKMSRYFVCKGCPNADELADQTMDRAIIKYSDDGTYPNAIALCSGIARKIWLEYQRKRKPEPLPDNDFLAVPENETEEREQEAQCLETCLSHLSARCRNLITRYYSFDGREKIEARKRLAAEHGGENTLRIKAFRIRGKLRVCVDDCMQRFSVN